MRITRLLTVLAVVLVCGADSLSWPAIPPAPPSAGYPVRLSDEIKDPNQTEGIVEVFQWALDRYQNLGLELPSMTVTFYRQRSRCSEFEGLWTSWDGGMRIDMCVAGEKKRKRILLHELAHAWVAVNLDQDSREAFMARRELPGWNGPSIERESQGIEMTAEIVMWGLDEHCEPSPWLETFDHRELTFEFQRLTGRALLCAAANLDRQLSGPWDFQLGNT